MRPSIAKKLYYRLTASLFVLWLGVVASVAWVVQHEADEVFDSNLQETAQRILPLAVHEEHLRKLGGDFQRFEPADHKEYLTYQIFDRNGVMLMRSHVAPLTPFPIPLQLGLHRTEDQSFFVDASKDGNFWIKLAEQKSHRKSTLNDTIKLLLLPLGALLPLAILLIHLSVRSVRKSLGKLDQELSTRGSRVLDPIPTTALPTELLGLGESVNLLLARLKGALEAERNFAANSAHELRTPIASAMAQLDVLREALSDPQTKGRVADARAMIERLEQMTVKLLQLARVESGMAFNVSQVNLTSLCKMLIRDHSFRSRRQVNLTMPELPVMVQGDLDAVGIVIQNLLENADRYAAEGSAVQVELFAEGCLRVTNDCTAISEELLPTLVNRFVRADQSKPGSGIGLSIVQTILVQCGAVLKLRSPCDVNGRGFEAEVCFSTD